MSTKVIVRQEGNGDGTLSLQNEPRPSPGKSDGIGTRWECNVLRGPGKEGQNQAALGLEVQVCECIREMSSCRADCQWPFSTRNVSSSHLGTLTRCSQSSETYSPLQVSLHRRTNEGRHSGACSVSTSVLVASAICSDYAIFSYG